MTGVSAANWQKGAGASHARQWQTGGHRIKILTPIVAKCTEFCTYGSTQGSELQKRFRVVQKR